MQEERRRAPTPWTQIVAWTSVAYVVLCYLGMYFADSESGFWFWTNLAFFGSFFLAPCLCIYLIVYVIRGARACGFLALIFAILVVLLGLSAGVAYI